MPVYPTGTRGGTDTRSTRPALKGARAARGHTTDCRAHRLQPQPQPHQAAHTSDAVQEVTCNTSTDSLCPPSLHTSMRMRRGQVARGQRFRSPARDSRAKPFFSCFCRALCLGSFDLCLSPP